MNDIEAASKAFDAILFADDSTFISAINASCPSQKLDTIFENYLNKELQKIYDWLVVDK